MEKGNNAIGIDWFAIAGVFMLVAGIGLFTVMIQSANAGVLGLSRRFYLIVSHGLLILQLAFAALFFGIGRILNRLASLQSASTPPASADSAPAETASTDPAPAETASTDSASACSPSTDPPAEGPMSLLMDLTCASLISGAVIACLYLLPMEFRDWTAGDRWLMAAGLGNLLYSIVFALAGVGVKRMLEEGFLSGA